MTAVLQVEETNIPRKIRSYGMEPVIDRQSHLSLSLSLSPSLLVVKLMLVEYLRQH